MCAMLVITASALASPVWGVPAVQVEIRVKEFLQTDELISDWVDSNTVIVPQGEEVYGLQGNFGIYLLPHGMDSNSVKLQYQLATMGTNVRQRSAIVNVEFGVPVVIDSIPGKSDSYYRALLTPRPTEVTFECREGIGNPTSWPSDPSAFFEFYYVPNSLADAHWNMLRDFLEKEYKTVHEQFDFHFPGKVHYYFCPCQVETIDYERGLGFAINPGRLAGYGIYNQAANTIDPHVTNLLKFYRWWGFAPRFLSWGVAGWTDFADYYAKEYLQSGELVPFDDLLISADYRAVDPLVAYYESASFVHFLIDSIGVAKFRDLYEGATDLTMESTFKEITGNSIQWWEQQWLRHLRQREFKYPEYVYYAHRAQAINRPTEQLEHLLNLVEIFGDTLHPSLMHELAGVYVNFGRHAESYRWFKNLVKAMPDNGPYHQYCGNMAVMVGDIDAAMGYFREAIELDTTLSAPFLSMGEIMYLHGQEDSARTLWKTGLGRGESIPIYADLMLNLGRLDRLNFRPDSAQAKFQRARNATNRLLQQNPDHPRYLLRMAEILTEMGKVDSAMIYYDAAEFFETRPAFVARIYLGRGRASDLAGDRAAAVENYQRVFELSAGYRTKTLAKRYLNRVYR